MALKNQSPYITNPQYTELTKFLIEKIENITPPINVWEVCREFKEKSKASQSITCLKERIKYFSLDIHKLPTVDINTKVKLLFALSTPLDYGFLKQLHKHADVTLDSSRRIIEYKEKGGTFQLNGQHGDPICMNQREKDMIDHLAKIAKITSSPLSGSLLVKKFKEATGASETIVFLCSRLRHMKKEIFELADFDMETKIRMLFVSGAELHDYVLEELRCDAHVKVDKQNRIMKYESKNGSLILEGDQNRPDRVEAGDNENMKTPSRSHLSDSDVDHEDSNETIENKNLTTRSGRRSKATDYYKNQELKNRPSTSEKRKNNNKTMGSNFNTPIIDKKRKLGGSMAGSSSLKKSAEEMESINETVEDDDISFDYTQPIEFHKRVKLEPFEGVLIDRATDKGDDDIQIYFPDQTEPLLIPKQEEHLTNEVKFDRPDYLLFAPSTETASPAIELKKPSIPSKQTREDMNSTSNQLPISSPSAIELKKPSITTKQNEEDVHDISHSISSSNKKDEFTTQLKALEAFHNLVLILNFPLLADFQKRIEEKIRNVERSEELKIAGSDIQMAMEACVHRVIRNSALSSNSEFASLREFLLVVKSVLFAFKFDCLKSFQLKLNKTMEELRDQDKRIPVEKVQSALQTALDIMDL